MTNRELSAIAMKVAHDLPGFKVYGSLIFTVTPQDVLLGLQFGGSSRDGRNFRLNAFFLPLYVLTDVIHFNYGKRINCIAGQWNADNPSLLGELDEAVKSEGVPFLNKVSTLPGVFDFLNAQIESNGERINPHTLEALACTFVKDMQYSTALRILNEQRQLLANATIHWMLDLRSRAQSMETILIEKPAMGLTQLNIWKAETIRNLGLDKYINT